MIPLGLGMPIDGQEMGDVRSDRVGGIREFLAEHLAAGGILDSQVAISEIGAQVRGPDGVPAAGGERARRPVVIACLSSVGSACEER